MLFLFLKLFEIRYFGDYDIGFLMFFLFFYRYIGGYFLVV